MLISLLAAGDPCLPCLPCVSDGMGIVIATIIVVLALSITAAVCYDRYLTYKERTATLWAGGKEGE